jgi:hypothetical protein
VPEAPVKVEDEGDEPNDSEGSEEEAVECEYRGIEMLAWLDVFNELANNLIEDYDEKDFMEFKNVVDASSFERAVQTLAGKTTSKALTDLANRCKVKVSGSKIDKVETLVLWKIGL